MDINEEIKNLTEAYANLLEANDKRGGAQKEVNKITRTKKDKNGEPVEVVSVADELFPYKGTAKEQYNQKILAKINDMIEGTATLEDLIQLIRQKKAVTMKESLEETLNQMMSVAEDVHTAIEKGAHKIKKPMLHAKAIMNHTNELQGAAKRELPKGKRSSFRAVNDKMNEIASKRGISPVDNYINTRKTSEALQETLDKMMAVTEAIINEISQETKDNAWNKTYDEMVKFRGRLEDEKKRYETGWGHSDKVMKAKKDLWNAEDRHQKMDNAIRKHNKAKSEGKIKPCNKKEEKEDDSK